MNAASITLATMATSGAALLVLLLFAPTLQAPFLVPKFAALEVTASLAWTAFLLRRIRAGGPRWSRSLSLGMVLVLVTTGVAWLVASTGPYGAPYGVTAVARWMALFGLACGASVLVDVPHARRRTLEAMAIAASIVAVVGLLQHVGATAFGIPVISLPGSTFGNRNAAAEVMAMSLPLGLGVAAGDQRRDARRVIYAGLFVQLLYLAVTRARGAWIGAACGVGATLWLTRPRWSRASVAVAFGALMTATLVASVPGHFNPRDAGDRKRYSGVVELVQEGIDAHSTALKSRLGLWHRTLSMVRDHPFFGVGPGNWPVEFPRYAEPYASRDGVLSATLAPRQAHDDALERAAETGLPGLVALGLLAVGASVAARHRLGSGNDDARSTTAGAAGALVALVTLAIASFPLEQPGTLALTGIALGLVAPRAEGRSPDTSELGPAARKAATYSSIVVGLILLSVCAVRTERSVRNSGWLAAAERAMHRDRGVVGASEAEAALNRALDAKPADYRAHLRHAQVLLRLGQSADSAQAARRALALEPNAPNAWVALAAAELASGDCGAARRDATRALAILHDFPFALQLRARAAEEQGDSQAAQEDRERLSALAGASDIDTARAARALLGPPN